MTSERDVECPTRRCCLRSGTAGAVDGKDLKALMQRGTFAAPSKEWIGSVVGEQCRVLVMSGGLLGSAADTADASDG